MTDAAGTREKIANLSRDLIIGVYRRASAVLFLLCFGSPLLAAEAQPNAFSQPKGVIFVLVDALRADHLGAYGSQRDLTPNLDALAEQSYVIENAVVTSSWTRASIASMFTSLYPTTLGVAGREDAIPSSTLTLPEALHAANDTECFAITTNGNAGKDFGFAQGFDGFEYPKEKSRYPGGFWMYPAEGVTRRAVRWLRRRDGHRPFFLFLHYTDPHDAYLPHPEILPEPEPAGLFNGSRWWLRIMDHVPKFLLRNADVDRIKYLYAGEVKYCDLWIGKLITALKELGIWDDSMFIVTADHGEGLWDHGRRAHGFDLYDETIRVPLVIKYPRMTPRDAGKIAELVSLVDLAPTILGAAGIAPPEQFQGRDLMPLIRSEPDVPHYASVYAEMNLDGINLDCVRTKRYKLIHNRTTPESQVGAYELFDLLADPKEQHNLTGHFMQARLRKALRDWHERVAAGSRKATKKKLEDLDDATRESLRALGYIE